MPSFIPRNSPTLGQKTAFFTGIKKDSSSVLFWKRKTKTEGENIVNVYIDLDC